MADSVYKIIIQLPSRKKKKDAVAKTDSNSSGDSEDKALTVNDAINGAKKVVAYSGIKMIAEKYRGHIVGTVSLRTGATEYEQRLQFVQGEVSQAMNSLESIGLGAAVGGVPGMIVSGVGVAFNYASRGIDWLNNAKTLNLESQLENIQQQMLRVRLGTSGSRSKEQ